MIDMNDGVKPGGAIQVELELRIESPLEEVWQALVHDAGSWWHKDFFVTKEPEAFVLEPRLGGKVYEDCGDGTGFVWFTVEGIQPPDYLYLVGHVRPPYGGPCTSLVEVRLSAEADSATRLMISDTVHGYVSDKMATSLDEGWKLLFGNLKAFVERG
jgi:uncharacterized protein YndB with AHSA1/START domain